MSIRENISLTGGGHHKNFGPNVNEGTGFSDPRRDYLKFSSIIFSTYELVQPTCQVGLGINLSQNHGDGGPALRYRGGSETPGN